MKTLTLNGKPVAVTKVGDSYLAFADECTHMHCSLSMGFLEGNVVECPCHGAKFDVSDGKVLALPATQPLGTYPTKIEGDQLMIDI